MTKRELIERFRENHQELIDYINALKDDKFAYSHHGRWTPGQQLSHIYLCLKPISQALASKEFIVQKFGKIDRSTFEYNNVIDNYKIALDKGGKAPDRFVPEQIDFNNKTRLSADLFELLQTIQQQLNDYTDEELDNLVLPHPLLGNLTIREMFYLMTYHAKHHYIQTEQNLEGYSGGEHP